MAKKKKPPRLITTVLPRLKSDIPQASRSSWAGLWKTFLRVGKLIAAIAAVLAGVRGYYQFRPNISISPDVSLDTSNLFYQQIRIKNEALFPIEIKDVSVEGLNAAIATRIHVDTDGSVETFGPSGRDEFGKMVFNKKNISKSPNKGEFTISFRAPTKKPWRSLRLGGGESQIVNLESNYGQNVAQAHL